MLLVYTTMKDMAEAKAIAGHIIAQRLAAGANIIPDMHSIYHWQGEIHHAEECVCLFQTTKENFNALEKAIQEKHSYEVPCIIAMPIEKTAKTFARWICEESLKLS